jgi:hypothetical protein
MTTSSELTWQNPAGGARQPGLAALIAGALAVWFVAVLALGAGGAFDAGPERPPLPILIAIVAPIALFALAYRGSSRVRAFALGLDLRLLTAMQSWRVLGAMFLAFYAFGMLPGLFAWPAGLGDAAVGLAAPFVVQAMIAGRANWQRSVLWLNIAGILDFVGAVGTGVLSSNSSLGFFATGAPAVSMGALPLSLVPTFAVPLWTILHIISFIQLRRLTRDARRA